jgi:hypothetical protein
MKTIFRSLTLMVICVWLSAPAWVSRAAPLNRAAPQTQYPVYAPFVTNGPDPCPVTSSNTYSVGPVFQRDNDNPVRPAWNHADKNLDLRGYTATSAPQTLVTLPTNPPAQPPQFATLFTPHRVPVFSSAHRVNNWNWGTPPDPGTRGGPITDWPVTALGLQTTPGEPLRVPTSAYDLGQGIGAIVIYADWNSLTLHYTRDDSAALGYTVHLDNLCPDPHLRTLYQQYDNAARNTYYGAPDNTVDYNLVTLTPNQVIGTARDNEIRVGMVDTGAFMDPRSCNDWWLIRPGVSCP